tara:strand:- start:62 stop:559 length:498 start_codon:yes stop_codon:yes gene_type:complete
MTIEWIDYTDGPSGPYSLARDLVTVADYAEFAKATGHGAPKGRPLQPVTRVTAHEADAYAEWAGARLPTEREIEWAWRFREDVTFAAWPLPELPDAGQYDTDTADGVRDLTGLVWHWTSSMQGAGRVIRGGGWNDGASYARVASRYGGVPSRRGDSLGFRLARTP